MFKTRKGARGLAQKYGFSHAEKCVSVQDSIEYCKKDGCWDMDGEIVTQGSRSDLEALSVRLRAGEEVGSVVDGDIELYTKYGRGMEFIREYQFWKNIKERDEEFPCEIHWFYGPAGSGKSRAAREAIQASHGNCWYDHVPDNNDWWDAYRGETAALFDEFAASSVAYKKLLRLTDRYKGRAVPKRNKQMLPFIVKVFYFTSVHRPEECYSGQAAAEGGIAQLLRRITEIKRFGPIEPVPGGEVLEAWLNAVPSWEQAGSSGPVPHFVPQEVAQREYIVIDE